jgi:hypothetical protein
MISDEQLLTLSAVFVFVPLVGLSQRMSYKLLLHALLLLKNMPESRMSTSIPITKSLTLQFWTVTFLICCLTWIPLPLPPPVIALPWQSNRTLLA